MLCVRAIVLLAFCPVEIGARDHIRIDNHDLSLLTMRTCRAVEKHRLGARNGHIECADFGLPVLKGNVPAVHASFHGRACRVGGRLGDGVVPVAELKLYDVADCGDDGVGDECVLGTANDDRDDLVGAAVQFELREGGGCSGDGQKDTERLHGGRIMSVI